MANPLNALNGAPVTINNKMVNAFNDVKIEVDGVDGVVTLWELLEYLGANIGGGSLATLSDVDLTSPSEGDTLTFDGTKWVNSNL